MKSLVLATVSVAALMVAGAASAQTFPYAPYSTQPTQGSAQVSASVDQTGNSDKSTVSQDHNATGAQNTAVIVQGFDGAGAYSDTSSATQSGAGQRALTMQANTGNSSSVSQSGANNDAFTYQTGNYNRASTSQSGSSAPANTGNIAGVNGSGSTGGGDNLAGSLVNMNEAQLEGTLETTGINSPSNPATVTGSYIVQASGAYNDGASVSQDAAGERAAIVQINSESNSSASVSQTNTLASDAAVYQTGGSGNTGNISQTGGYLSAAIYQSGSTNSTAGINESGSSSGNIAFAVQTGTGQQSYITQSGSLDQARSDQSGAYNYSSVNQTGLEGNTGAIYQSGTGNQSYLTQTGNGTSGGQGLGNKDGATADVTQNGTYNVSYVTQNLGNAWVHVAQTGASNSSSISQSH